jgi:mRNA interferase RelE/StbE
MKFIYTARFRNEVTKLSASTKKVLREKLSLLIENPSHPSLRTKKIKGTRDIFEASVTMSIRITFQYIKGDILLRNIGEHDKTIGNP